MADDWEDWESEEVAPAPPPVPKGDSNGELTAGEVALRKAQEIDMSKFANETLEVEVEVPKGAPVPKPQQSKKTTKGYEVKSGEEEDVPLDDPLAEKLRQQRLIEQSDFAATLDLFGGSSVNLDTFIPKTARDHEDLAKLIALRYILPCSTSPHYKSLMKALLRTAAGAMGAQEVKDLETSLAGVRAEKVKEEAAAKAAAKKGAKKKTLNVGKSGGSAGLDDYIYDEALPDDEVDFM